MIIMKSYREMHMNIREKTHKKLNSALDLVRSVHEEQSDRRKAKADIRQSEKILFLRGMNNLKL
jgi:hypothetical protein